VRTIESQNGAAKESRFDDGATWTLVHDGARVLLLTPPGTVNSTPAANTMLAGTKTELEAEIVRLGLQRA
jgi:hypothetical protein